MLRPTSQKVIRIAFAVSVGITIASVVLRFALQPGEHPRRQSQDLIFSFLGYSNGMAVVELKNRAKEAVQLAYGYIEIEFRNPTNGSISAGEPYLVSNNSLLAPGALFRESFPPPTNRLCWRASLAAFDVRELNRKRALEHNWLWRNRPRCLFKQYPKLDYVHADTDWISP